MAGLLVPPQLQFMLANGSPAAGGQLFCFQPGTTVPKNTFQTADESILNENPIILDVRGACTVFGDGDYRLILNDSAGNQVFDTLASEQLPVNTISGVMLPVVGALSLQQARDLMGVTDAIQAAVGAIALMPGPSGPAGPQGPVGPVGPQGSAGASAANSTALSLTNPGWWIDNNTGFLLQFGFAGTDASGHATVGFARGYSSSVIAVLATSATAWANVSGITNGGFAVNTKSPLATGNWDFGPIGFWWVALGK